MKRTLLLVLLLLPALALSARGPRFSYGLEWGYTGTFLRTHQYNYIYSEGARIVDNDAFWWYYSNGSVLADVGLDLGDKVNLSVYSGLLGVYSRRWMVPIELRTRWCPNGLENNGPLAHLGTSITIPTSTLQESTLRINAGGGYRFCVYRHLSVDFLMCLVVTGDHDLIRDPDTDFYVPSKNITKNYSQYWGVNMSVAINF
ncbi:MAG: hypothetical protein J5695_04905 [Bacteroidales bacterium]|nr:hypothetical protein [Bacteroidales bacterium]MBO4566546.1 hypothetical protein [Bacteroidales bacterium]